MPPLNRRDFLSTVAVAAPASMGLSGLLLSRELGAQPAFSPALPGGHWHYPAQAELIPFGHAVASGDPLADRVILWTRITIPDARGWDVSQIADPQGISQVDVGWLIARDPELNEVVNSGVVTTDASRDFTVKVDAGGLQPATTYYYAFIALGFRSPIGRTRTAPAVGQGISELTIGHVACTSWWQDYFNGYARMGERGDIDLITHAGDHVYEVSGNHMSSRQYPDAQGNPQLAPYEDIDNRHWRNLGECRRRYALYYQCPNLMQAHLGAPFAIMADQHDYEDYEQDAQVLLSRAQAGEVYHEWTPMRSPLADGSGQFPAASGADQNYPVPRGEDAFYSYRALDFGDVATIILIDVRRHRDDNAEMTILGDRQWQWLQDTLLASKARGARHNIIVNQLNMAPFSIAANELAGVLPDFEWDARPADRARLFQFLRDNEILDNIVLSGDSHGWFGSDLTEDTSPASYTPLTGTSALQPVGVEMVGTSMGRPGAQDVIADELYWGANGGRQNAPFDDAQNYDSAYRTAALAPALGIQTDALLENPHLIYFNWLAEYGHAMVHLREDEALIENWVSPQREPSDSARLVAQHRTPRGNPHLTPALDLMLQPISGSRQDAPAPSPAIVPMSLPPSATPAPSATPLATASPTPGSTPTATATPQASPQTSPPAATASPRTASGSGALAPWALIVALGWRLLRGRARRSRTSGDS